MLPAAGSPGMAPKSCAPIAGAAIEFVVSSPTFGNAARPVTIAGPQTFPNTAAASRHIRVGSLPPPRRPSLSLSRSAPTAPNSSNAGSHTGSTSALSLLPSPAGLSSYGSSTSTLPGLIKDNGSNSRLVLGDSSSAFTSQASLFANLPYPHVQFPHIHFPSHVHLPTPVMPVIHLMSIICHLVLSVLIPYFLFSNFIQPLVLWVLATVTVVMESLYLVPGIVLETIGLCRRRPVDSAWLQSGLHLTIMTLAILPHTLTVALLITANQIPTCPSALVYQETSLPNFESHLRWSACAALPKVTILAIMNVVVLILEVVVTGGIVGIDYWMQGRELEEQVKKGEISMTEDGEKIETKTLKKQRRKRRWMTGVGRLLWDIEGIVLHRRARNRGVS